MPGCFITVLDRQAETIRFPDPSGRTLADLIEACPEGASIELAPGRYVGPFVLRKPVCLRGAGDLTRIASAQGGPVVAVETEGPGSVVLESLLIEHLEGDGPGLCLFGGRLKAHNLQIQNCRSDAGGGGIHVVSGALELSRIRVHDVAGERGGALYVGGNGIVSVRDSQVNRAEARFGGAIAVEHSAAVLLEGITVGRTRATMPAGGQAIYVAGSDESFPTLQMRRVRLEDAPFGMPLVVDARWPGEVSLSECDLPRMVLGVPGVIDGGRNHWR